MHAVCRRAQWSLQKQDSGEGGGATGPGKSAALLAGVTRDLRRGEARKRHGISSSSVPSPDGQPTEAQVMGLDVLLDQAVLSVPHDEVRGPSNLGWDTGSYYTSSSQSGCYDA
jgi:hypothetical protein